MAMEVIQVSEQFEEPKTGSRLPGSDRSEVVTRAFKQRFSSPAWLARAAGSGLCIVSLGFIVALAVPVANQGAITLITKPFLVQVALFLPYLVLLFTVGTVVGTVVAWWGRYWSLAARIHQTILALLGLALVWQFTILGFLA
jgi:hypothetical protein